MHFEIATYSGFSLEAAAGFGFGPNTGRPTAAEAELRMAFVTDDLRNYAGLQLRQGSNGVVVVEGDSGARVDALEAQVRRIRPRVLDRRRGNARLSALSGDLDPAELGRLASYVAHFYESTARGDTGRAHSHRGETAALPHLGQRVDQGRGRPSRADRVTVYAS